MHALQLLVVADDPLAGTGLSMLLDELPDCHIIGQFPSRVLASELHLLSYPAPDAILWVPGWELPDPLPEWLDTAVPIVALLGEDRHAPGLWSAGIRALVRRDTTPEKLLDVTRAACQGLIVLEPEWAPTLMPAMTLPETSPSEELTPREFEVLQLLAEGLTNKAIGQRLAISDHTVKFHVNAILGKLAAQSRTEAVVQATRAGLISL